MYLAHLDIDLHTHIEDILMVLHYEDLYEVILVGYRGSGPVISGVAEKAAERIGHLVYLDAFVLAVSRTGDRTHATVDHATGTDRCAA
ncbi:MAG TPA: hypothetical protein P5121_35185 [Caldilineaceae bacterium]|nr:hypothetical protein [Caldilineaceae bacterium]